MAAVTHPAPGPRRLRVAALPLVALAVLALLGGLTGALVLLGVGLPAATVRLGGAHGVLMTLGFLGTLITLERAVALGRRWAYVAPGAAAVGGVALLVGQPPTVRAAVFSVGAAVFVVMYVAFDRIEPTLHGRVQAAGAAAWLVAAVLLLVGRPVSSITPWLAAFLVLTIAGERLELSRLGRLSPRARAAFVAVAGTFVTGVALTLVAPDVGVRIGAAGLVGLAAWLARNDLARRTVHATGVTRFIAACLLMGYGWLAVAGGVWLVAGDSVGGAAYDVRVHALFLGFVISMVFGHAPLILPAVLRRPLPYAPRFYVHLGLLHLGLAVRVVGDLAGSAEAWQAGGVLNVVALLVFLGSSAVAMLAPAAAARAGGVGAARPAPR